MEKEKSALGSFVDRLLKDGDLGEMKHTIETKSLILLGAVLVVSGAAILAIKKFIFK